MKNINSTILLFILSPIYSVPLILRDIYHNHKSGYFLLGLFFAIASYLYIPGSTGDKAYYFELHRTFSELDISGFLFFLKENSTDYIFYIIIFLFAKLGFSFSFTSAMITFITISSFIFVFRKTIQRFDINKPMIFFFFIMLLGTLSLPALFSGMRFYLSAGFTMIGLYYSFIEEKNFKGILFLVLATLTHFGTFIYLFLTIVYIIFNKKFKLLQILFLFSFFFPIIPQELSIYTLKLFNFNPIFVNKINVYIITQSHDIVTNTGHFIYLISNKLWYFIAIIYILINFKNNNKFMALMILTLIIENLTYMFPTVFYRYAYISTIAFVLLLIYDYSTHKRSQIIRNIFFSLLIFTTLLDILIQRGNFQNSYEKIEVLTLPTLIIYNPMDEIKIIWKAE